MMEGHIFKGVRLLIKVHLGASRWCHPHHFERIHTQPCPHLRYRQKDNISRLLSGGGGMGEGEGRCRSISLSWIHNRWCMYWTFWEKLSRLGIIAILDTLPHIGSFFRSAVKFPAELTWGYIYIPSALLMTKKTNHITSSDHIIWQRRVAWFLSCTFLFFLPFVSSFQIVRWLLNRLNRILIAPL